MAHLLYDSNYLFDLGSINPSEVYELTIGNEVYSNDFLSIKWIISNCPDQLIAYREDIAKYGYFDCLKYLHELGYIKDGTYTFAMVKYGQLDILKYLLEEGCFISDYSCDTAIINGQLDILKYLHQQGFGLPSYTCDFAAENGHLECLKYLHENNYPWDQSTCFMTAIGGHLDCLIYLHENNCLWKRSTCSGAASRGHLECLIYAHENGCPWDFDTVYSAAINGHLQCFEYAQLNGCAWEILEYMKLRRSGYIPELIDAFRPRTKEKSSHKDIYDYLASSGEIDCIQYAMDNGWTRTDIPQRHIFERKTDAIHYLLGFGFSWNEKAIIKSMER